MSNMSSSSSNLSGTIQSQNQPQVWNTGTQQNQYLTDEMIAQNHSKNRQMNSNILLTDEQQQIMANAHNQNSNPHFSDHRNVFNHDRAIANESLDNDGINDGIVARSSSMLGGGGSGGTGPESG